MNPPQQTYNPFLQPAPPAQQQQQQQQQHQPQQQQTQTQSQSPSNALQLQPPRVPINTLGPHGRPRPELKGHRGPKSKTGCRSCKVRRIKCDETKPQCLQCKRKGVECFYNPSGHSASGSSDSTSSSRVTAGNTKKLPSTGVGSASDSTKASTARAFLPSTNSTATSSPQIPRPALAVQQEQRHDEPSPSPIMRNLMRLNHGKPPLSLTPPLPIHIDQLLNGVGSSSTMHEQNMHARMLGGTQSNTPSTASFDDEIVLLNTFFATATHLLSVYTGDCNPFMRLRRYLPQSRAVSLALQAMASFIASGYAIEDKQECLDRGLELQQLAYQEIQQLMKDGRARMEDPLFAAIIHIGMTEPWHPIRANESGTLHLQASKMLIVERARAGKQLPPRFLVNLLVYWDMLVALHSDTSADGWSTSLLEGRCVDEEPIDYIDPTLGLGQTLFPIIVELENFLRYVRTQREVQGAAGDEIVSDHDREIAMGLEHRLQAWRPSLDPMRLQGCLGVFETCKLEDLIFTAEAYKQCSLLLLYRTFPHALHPTEGDEDEYYYYRGVPRSHMLESLASRVINLLRCISGRSPTCCTHQWVLFVVSPDVVSMPERHFIRERMDLLLEKVGIDGIRDVMRYIEDVWLAQDAGRVDSSKWLDAMYANNWFPLLG